MTDRQHLIEKFANIEKFYKEPSMTSSNRNEKYYLFLYGILGGEIDVNSLKIIHDLEWFENDSFWRMLIYNRIGLAGQEQVDTFEKFLSQYE